MMLAASLCGLLRLRRARMYRISLSHNGAGKPNLLAHLVTTRPCYTLDTRHVGSKR